MIRTVFVPVLLAISCFSPALAGQAPEPVPQNMTLADAVRVALEKNPTVQAVVAYAQAVHEGIAEAKAARLPRAGFFRRIHAWQQSRLRVRWLADRAAIHGE